MQEPESDIDPRGRRKLSTECQHGAAHVMSSIKCHLPNNPVCTHHFTVSSTRTWHTYHTSRKWGASIWIHVCDHEAHDLSCRHIASQTKRPLGTFSQKIQFKSQGDVLLQWTVVFPTVNLYTSAWDRQTVLRRKTQLAQLRTFWKHFIVFIHYFAMGFFRTKAKVS